MRAGDVPSSEMTGLACSARATNNKQPTTLTQPTYTRKPFKHSRSPLANMPKTRSSTKGNQLSSTCGAQLSPSARSRRQERRRSERIFAKAITEQIAKAMAAAFDRMHGGGENFFKVIQEEIKKSSGHNLEVAEQCSISF